MNQSMEILSRDEAIAILELADDALPDLLNTVYEIRKKHKGNLVNIQLLTNGRSGNCTQNCAYCAQSQTSEAEIETYPMVTREKLAADSAVVEEKNLARHCIGFSGIRFQDEEIAAIAEEIRNIKEERNTPICCSIGFLTKAQALLLKDAGVNRINHNLNTSKRNYPNICTSHTYEERVENIKMLQSIGFEICCGGIIGLGESVEDVVDMLLEIQSIAPQAVPINFFIPIQGTPLSHRDTSYLTWEYCLKVLCLARILNPKADIRCAAGREIYLKGKEKWMFYAVDSIFASGYLTAHGQAVEDAIKSIEDAGFEYKIECD